LRQNLLLWECGDESFDDGECGISDSSRDVSQTLQSRDYKSPPPGDL